MKKTIDVYDFDKTLYLKDSTIEFWKFILFKEKKLILLLPYQFINLILYYFKLITTKRFKESFLIILKFISKDLLQIYLEEFWSNELKNMNKNLVEKINLNNNFSVCISASPEFLLKIPCKEIGIKTIIGTKYSTYKFKIIGENCKGNQKVRRLKEEIIDFEIINCYSDSLSDLPLFNLSKYKYFIKKGEIYNYEKNI